jgi:hypothetical protein
VLWGEDKLKSLRMKTEPALRLFGNVCRVVVKQQVERTLKADGLWEEMEAADRRGLTPLFYSHINPYGHFELNLDRPLLQEAA